MHGVLKDQIAPPNYVKYYAKTGKNLMGGARGAPTIETGYQEYLERCKINHEEPMSCSRWINMKAKMEI